MSHQVILQVQLVTFYPNIQGITMAMTDEYHEHKYDETQQCTLVSNVFLVSFPWAIIFYKVYAASYLIIHVQYSEDETINVHRAMQKCRSTEDKASVQNLTMHKSGQQRSMGTNLEVMVMVCACRIKKRFMVSWKH